MFLKDIKIAFLEQEYDFDPEKSVFDQIMSSSEEFTRGLDQEHIWEYERRVVKFLSNFNLNDPDQKMKELSGGEVKRVALTQMLASEAEFFVMDEPTNHLDIGSCEALENALLAFDGTIVAVSHDRYFINRIASRIIELAPERENGMVDCQLESYDDAFTEYMRIRESRNLMQDSTRKSAAVTDSKAEYEEKKREKARARSEEKQRERAEKKIQELESELEALDAELFGEAATDYMRAAEIEERKSMIEEELLSLYELVM